MPSGLISTCSLVMSVYPAPALSMHTLVRGALGDGTGVPPINLSLSPTRYPLPPSCTCVLTLLDTIGTIEGVLTSTEFLYLGDDAARTNSGFVV